MDIAGPSESGFTGEERIVSPQAATEEAESGLKLEDYGFEQNQPVRYKAEGSEEMLPGWGIVGVQRAMDGSGRVLAHIVNFGFNKPEILVEVGVLKQMQERIRP